VAQVINVRIQAILCSFVVPINLFLLLDLGLIFNRNWVFSVLADDVGGLIFLGVFLGCLFKCRTVMGFFSENVGFDFVRFLEEMPMGV
jgi:hypothetical protein